MTCFYAKIFDITKNDQTRYFSILDNMPEVLGQNRFGPQRTVHCGRWRMENGSRSRCGYLHVDLYLHVINIVTNHNS